VILHDDIPVFARHQVQDMLMKDKFFEQCQASKNLDLKVGAQVMLLQNLTLQGLVNGSRGVIEAFKLCPVAKNIHKVERLLGPDDGDKFPGRKFEDLKFGMKLEFEGFIWTISKFTKMPYVKFMNGTSKIITPAPFERILYRKGGCRRLQVPLRLAWAITMHKSQGSTLDLVVCDLKGCFTTVSSSIRRTCLCGMASSIIKKPISQFVSVPWMTITNTLACIHPIGLSRRVKHMWH
jgi:ATP-dependent exoDNAse (exonuclease V) alpha subunit